MRTNSGGPQMFSTRPQDGVSLPRLYANRPRTTTSHRGRKEKAVVRLTRLLRVLILIGYPIVGVVAAFAGEDSQTVTIPFRAAVLGLAIWVLALSMKTENIRRLDVLLVVFLLVYSVRLLYDWRVAGIEDAEIALLMFWGVVVIPVVASSLRVIEPNDRHFARLLLISGLLFAALVLLAKQAGLTYNPWAEQNYDPNRLMFQALNPISIGEAAGLLIITSLVILHDKSFSRSLRFWAVLGGVVGAYLILSANSRGPIVALAMALSVFYLVRAHRILAIVLALGLAFSFGLADQAIFQDVMDRFSIVGSSVDGSSTARLRVQLAAWEAFWEHPVFGAFYLDPTYGPGYYPHNLVIEAAMALGVLGLLAFLILLGRSILSVIRTGGSANALLKMMTVYYVVSAMFSGAIWGSPELFLIMGLTLCSLDRRLVQPRGNRLAS